MKAAVILLASTCVLVPTLHVVDAPGLYRTDGSTSCVEFLFGEGEAGNLRVVPGPSREPFKDGLPRAQDATSFAWLSAGQIVFSSSPIYGEGGLWRYDLGTKQLDEIGPIDKPAELEYFWTKLISVSAESITCWVAGVNELNTSDLEHTAKQRSFRWGVRPKPLRPHN